MQLCAESWSHANGNEPLSTKPIHPEPPPPPPPHLDPHISPEPSKTRGEPGQTRLADILITYLVLPLVVLTFPISIFFCFKMVAEFERALIYRLGRIRMVGAKGPGLIFVLPCTDTMQLIDVRTMSFEVPPQEILTKDSVKVSVDAVVFYRVVDPLNAIIGVENYSFSTRLLAATTLRTVLGTCDLSQLLSNREAISNVIQITLDNATEPWGVTVERVEVKDVRLPEVMQRAIATEAGAGREANAKIIAAEGEVKASEALKTASEMMVDNPMALQLRYLHTMKFLASEKHSTVVFPFPMEFGEAFLGNVGNK